MTQYMANSNLKQIALEMIYKSILYTMRKEGVEFDEKHEEMANALCYSHPETDVIDLPDMADEIYELLKNLEEIKEQLHLTNFNDVNCNNDSKKNI